MKVKFEVEVDDALRRALFDHPDEAGETGAVYGKATAHTVRAWIAKSLNEAAKRLGVQCTMKPPNKKRRTPTTKLAIR
jgi:hypothetical protein